MTEEKKLVRLHDGSFVEEESIHTDSIDDTLSEDELREAWQKQVEQSHAWKEHAKKHKDARIVAVGEEHLKQNNHDQGAFLGYTHNKVYPIASCICGDEFEVNEESGTVYNIGGSETGSIYNQKSSIYKQDSAAVKYGNTGISYKK